MAGLEKVGAASRATALGAGGSGSSGMRCPGVAAGGRPRRRGRRGSVCRPERRRRRRRGRLGGEERTSGRLQTTGHRRGAAAARRDREAAAASQPSVVLFRSGWGRDEAVGLGECGRKNESFCGIFDVVWESMGGYSGKS